MMIFMNYIEIFWVFFLTNILGYGGGPATIPLVSHEVITNFGWMTEAEFVEMIAVGNILPGPIATKMAGFIGYLRGNAIGATLALIATTVPSLWMKITLMSFLLKHKNSSKVKKITTYVKPIIVVLLMAVMFQNVNLAIGGIGFVHVSIISISAYYLLKHKKTHPALVICSALIYGAMLGISGQV